MKKKCSVVLSLLFISGIAGQTDVLANDKKVERAISSYTKHVEKAFEKDCNIDSGKSGKLLERSCDKAIKALDKRYDGYSDEIKSHPQMAELHARHLELQTKLAEIGEFAANAKVIDPYQRELKTAQTKNCLLEQSFNDYKCAESLIRAEEIYERIQVDKRDLAQVVELRKLQAELVEIQKQMTAKNKAASEASTERVALINEFREKVRVLPFGFLTAGKNNEPISLHDVAMLDGDMAELDAFFADCQTKFADVIEENRDYLGKTAQEVYELVENRVQYRNQAAAASAHSQFAKVQASNTELIDKFAAEGYVRADVMNKFTHEWDAYYNKIVGEIDALCKSAGADSPAFDNFAKLPEQFDTALQKALANNTWKGKELTSMPSQMKKLAKKTVQYYGFDYKEGGFIKGANWAVKRNALEIPIERMMPGYILLKDKNESFCRQHFTEFFQSYNGSKYDDATSVQYVPVLTPVACR